MQLPRMRVTTQTCLLIVILVWLYREFVNHTFYISKEDCDSKAQRSFGRMLKIQQISETVEKAMLEVRAAGKYSHKSNFSSVCEEYDYYVKAPKVIVKNVFQAPTQDSEAVTFVSQMSIGRWAMLKKVYLEWTGPSSIGLYVRLDETDSIIPTLIALADSLDVNLIGLHLLIDAIDNPLYPVNQLRNLALRSAETKRVCLIDIDFITSPNLHDHIQQMKTKNKEALAIPVFELVGKYDVQSQPHDKATLVNFVKQKKARIFHIYFDASGQSPVNLTRWLTATQPYKVRYRENFEPLICVEKEGLPPYEDMLLYGDRDKMLHIKALHRKGYTITVLHNEFLIHQDHVKRVGMRHKNKRKYKSCLSPIIQRLKQAMNLQGVKAKPKGQT